MWKVNGGLNGTPDANSSDEAMSHNSRTFTNIANIFMSHYARISKLHMSKADLDLNHHSKKQLDQPSADDESCAPFQKGELLSAMKKINLFLNHLVLWSSRNHYPYSTHLFLVLTVQEFGLLSSSFHYCKLGNPPVRLYLSAQPVFKSLEKVLADRLYYITETKILFSQFQPGFCKGWSCQDQIT